MTKAMTIFQDSEDLSSSDDDEAEDSIESPFAEGMKMPDPVREDDHDDHDEDDEDEEDEEKVAEDEFLPAQSLRTAVQGMFFCSLNKLV